jgi:hypothetical protein
MWQKCNFKKVQKIQNQQNMLKIIIVFYKRVLKIITLKKNIQEFPKVNANISKVIYIISNKCIKNIKIYVCSTVPERAQTGRTSGKCCFV